MNVQSPQFIINPYAFYAEKRAQNPIFKRSEFEWTLTGFEAMSAFLANPAAGRGNIGQAPVPFGDTDALEEVKKQNLSLQVLDRWMLFQNPPRHTVSRKRIADIFTLKLVAQLEQSLRDCLQQLIANIIRSNTSEVDFIRTVAGPYPLHAICQLLGIPVEQKEVFLTAASRFTRAAEADFSALQAPALEALNQSTEQLLGYFEKVIPKKRKTNNDDLINRFIAAEGEDFELEDLLANCVFLLFAGQETTTSQCANTLFALLEKPERWQQLVSHPELIDNAVEESFRFDPAIQMVGRFALDEIRLDQTTINRGDHVFCFIGAAGRDPAANQDPDRFDLTRDKPKHLAFARGAHHCLGASLARLELKVLLEELSAAFPNLSLARPATRRRTWVVRGFDKLPVRIK